MCLTAKMGELCEFGRCQIVYDLMWENAHKENEVRNAKYNRCWEMAHKKARAMKEEEDRQKVYQAMRRLSVA